MLVRGSEHTRVDCHSREATGLGALVVKQIIILVGGYDCGCFE